MLIGHCWTSFNNNHYHFLVSPIPIKSNNPKNKRMGKYSCQTNSLLTKSVGKTLAGYKRGRPLPVLTRSRSRLPRGIPLNGVPHGGVPSQ